MFLQTKAPPSPHLERVHQLTRPQVPDFDVTICCGRGENATVWTELDVSDLASAGNVVKRESQEMIVDRRARGRRGDGEGGRGRYAVNSYSTQEYAVLPFE